MAHLKLGDISVDVVYKDIKNIHLSVYPPHGRVRIAVPSRMREDTIRAFLITKIPWMRKQQQKLQEQERETNRELLSSESHYVFGKRYLLKINEQDAPASIQRNHRHIILNVRPGTSEQARQAILDEWYRNLLKETAEPIIKQWEPRLGVTVKRVFIQHMKTKWGSCNRQRATIRLNTELAKKPQECLEYLIVHELVHLIEPTHNERFKTLMSQHLPRWQHHRALLNRLPLRHEEWEY